jgi:thiamine biosynthesis lipoprotein
MPQKTHFMAIALLLATPSGSPGEGTVLERRLQAMGTELNLVVSAPDRATALAASDAAFRAIQAAERRLSTWTPDSELSRVNHAAVGEEVRLTPPLARDLGGALDCARATDGAFAPGVGALVQAWGLRSGGRWPDAREIDEARSAASPTNVRFDGERITRVNDRFVFEEGGFGKGAGLDDAMTALETTAASGAVLDLGGQVAVWGDVVSDVAIADPRRRDDVALRMNVRYGSIATTGNSERGIVVDGRRLGHVLDPRTGRPSPDFGSLTVWAEDAATADCLATGLYVLGPEAALCWAAGRDDVAVVVLRETRLGLEALASPVLRDRLTGVAGDLVLRFPAAPGCEERSRSNESSTSLRGRTPGIGVGGVSGN